MQRALSMIPQNSSYKLHANADVMFLSLFLIVSIENVEK
jgi:hypothetical protein